MNPEEKRQFEELKAQVATLVEENNRLKAGGTIPYDLEYALRARLLDVVDGTKFAASYWTANGTAAISVTNLGPAGVGTSTIAKWFTVIDQDGAVFYIPAWT